MGIAKPGNNSGDSMSSGKWKLKMPKILMKLIATNPIFMKPAALIPHFRVKIIYDTAINRQPSVEENKIPLTFSTAEKFTINAFE